MTHADVQLFPLPKPKPVPQPAPVVGQGQGLQFQPRRSLINASNIVITIAVKEVA
jgi:hypothetical protein